MNRRVFYFSLLGLSLASCSSVDNKRAAGDFDYAEKQEAAVITIPEGLKKPAQYNDYFVSDKINLDGPVGSDVDVRAPSLVLPVAASSRVVNDSDKAIIWFDKVVEDKDLALFIYSAIEEQLNGDEVALNVVDAEQKTFESDWYHSEVESGFWPYKTVEQSESMRFRYQLEAKPHGRSVSLTVSLIDYMKTDQSGGTKSIDPIDQQRAEMAMLNEIVAQVDYKYRLQQKENRLMRATQQLVSIGENPEAEPAYIVEMKTDMLWANLPAFFSKYGFDITDMNEGKKIYFVDFVKPDNSIWATIWGDGIPVIDIDEAKYRFELAEIEDKTSVTIYDADGKVLPQATLTHVYDVMEEGLSFRTPL
ncbi:outer membrane protein assembly factor BamC [Thalassomonas sp. RHCl1]|uniref:outer membrane protein assembly factor BamC n=1 Tax=Thalassomonas sp. RHCl1 TaxID=2995320 RepID=UPI00248B5C40|nr:outer membrane protein assembly factor BamC [Thalassomonas sp. RHCl1]